MFRVIRAGERKRKGTPEKSRKGKNENIESHALENIDRVESK